MEKNVRDHQSGPLNLALGPPLSQEAATAAWKVLRGHATAANWIVEGLSSELDALHDEHLRIRSQLAGELDELAALDAQARVEDKQHGQKLLQAHRDGRPPAEVEDQRTPAGQREAERAEVAERRDAGIVVLGEVVTRVFAYFKAHEPELLAELRQQREPAVEKRRQAEQALAEARIEEWHIYALGMWVQRQTDRVHGAQPAPAPSEPPAMFSKELLDRALERPFHRQEEPMVPWGPSQPDQVADPTDLPEGNEPDPALPVGDPTGVVSGLEETGARS
jgi:hypothetical protein